MSMFMTSFPTFDITNSSLIFFIRENFDFGSIFSNIGYNIIVYQMSLSASDAKNQVIERGTTENVDVIGSIGPTARVEAVGFVRHFVGDDGDVGGVVTFDFPAFVAHVAGAEEVDGAVAFAEDHAVVDLAVRGGDGGVCGCVVLGSCFYFLLFTFREGGGGT